MRLSEAIRLGSMLKPQAFGASYNGTGTCALGAVYDAHGVLATKYHSWPWLIAAYPILKVIENEHCPICGEFQSIIPHLNDDHRWTREQIADWVESIERQHEVGTVTEIPSAVQKTPAGGLLAVPQ